MDRLIDTLAHLGEGDAKARPESYQYGPVLSFGMALLHVERVTGNRTRTVSLGTELSCLFDHGATGQAAPEVVRGYPTGTARDSSVGYATGTLPAPALLYLHIRLRLSLVRESSSSARERVDALDAEVLPFSVWWYVPVPAAHPAPRAGICKHVFDRTVNKTPNSLEDLAELSHDVFSSTYLNRASQRAGLALARRALSWADCAARSLRVGLCPSCC